MVSRGAAQPYSGAVRLAGPAAEFGGVAQFAAGGSAVSVDMSAEALRHLQLAARLPGGS
jgi:hypothetical protein